MGYTVHWRRAERDATAAEWAGVSKEVGEVAAGSVRAEITSDDIFIQTPVETFVFDRQYVPLAIPGCPPNFGFCKTARVEPYDTVVKAAMLILWRAGLITAFSSDMWRAEPEYAAGDWSAAADLCRARLSWPAVREWRVDVRIERAEGIMHVLPDGTKEPAELSSVSVIPVFAT